MKKVEGLRKKYLSSLRDPLQEGVVTGIVLESPQLSYIFGGKFPRGRLVEFFGPESGGKTALSLYVAKSFQTNQLYPDQRLVVFVDFERSFNVAQARSIGVDLSPELFVLIKPTFAEDALQQVEDFIRTGEVGLVIIDSVASMVTREAYSSEYGKVSYGGDLPRLLAMALPRLVAFCDDHKASIIFINQVRAKMGGGPRMFYPGADEKTTGGRSLPFYASWRGRVSKSEDVLDDRGNLIGTKIKVRNVKSKLGIPKRQAELTLIYDRGFVFEKEFFDLFVKMGVLQQSGSWYSARDIQGFPKLQGEAAVMNYLRENPLVFETLRQKVYDSIGSFGEGDVIDRSSMEDGGEVAEDDYE